MVEATRNEMANAIRVLSADAVEKAASGHPGMPLGMADVATILFSDFLKFNPADPNWADRDRFILSAGHGSMLLYSLLYLTGYEDMSLEEIKNFRQFGAKAAGHPEYGYSGGIETTTGPLGQGIANAVGMAMAEKLSAARFSDNIVDHCTYTIVGDGCLMEGISHEAISIAGHLKLGKLIVLFDDNRICIDGPTDLTVSDDQSARFAACGWDVQEIDGHNHEEIAAAIEKAKGTDAPSFIACRTTIAFGAPTKADSSSSHGAPLGKEEIAGLRKNLDWDSIEPFFVPEHILGAWREAGKRSAKAYQEWKEKFANMSSSGLTRGSGAKDEFNRLQAGVLPEGFGDTVLELKKGFSDEKVAVATRKSSSQVLEKLTTVVPELLGGSADLTGSNLTKTSSLRPINADDFSGRYVYYGVREHAMCAIMNGMALHKGVIPYGGTFFVFSDYCRPAIRMAALMKQRVIYVMTHDSIGLGEDGPTHQPVEHLASLRAMPNVNIFRPADSVEVAESWQLSIESAETPSMLVLSRQNLPLVRTEHTKENLSAKGGYVLSDSDEAQVTLIASGSEVEIAMEAQGKLANAGISAKVVSMPCTELFDVQSEEYKKETLGEGTLKVGIEAGSSFGWERYIGKNGIFIGMNGFGASAPAGELYQHFGITAKAVVDKVKAAI